MSVKMDRDVERRYCDLADKLTSVTGFSELLLTGAYGPLTPEQARVLKSVVDQAKLACEIVRLGRPI